MEKIIDFVQVKLVRDKSLKYSVPADTPENAYLLMKEMLKDVAEEHVYIACLNPAAQIVNLSLVGKGTVDSCNLSVMDILKTAILSNSRHIILFHNHPSGDTKPSKEDIGITRKLKEAANLMDIELLDHIIIGNEDYYSFRKEGKII